MKVYNAIYTGAVAGDTVPKNKPTLTISAHKLSAFQIPVASSEGRVVAVFVQQKTGTPVGFTVELLTSAVPYPFGEQAYNAAPAVTPGLFRAIPQKAATAGNPVEYFDDVGLTFLNADQLSQTQNNRFLVLVIIPATDPTANTWEVRITTEHQGSGV